LEILGRHLAPKRNRAGRPLKLDLIAPIHLGLDGTTVLCPIRPLAEVVGRPLQGGVRGTLRIGEGAGYFFRLLPALLRAIATACFCGRPAFVSVLMLLLTTFWLLPFFNTGLLLRVVLIISG
jgi:hypothetical protein